MKRMKKWSVILCLAALAATLLVGCGKTAPDASTPPAGSGSISAAPTDTESLVVRIASLKGPTTMGLVKLMADSEQSGKYDVTMYTAADEIVPLIVKGEVDIALIPANLAATLYQKTEKGIAVLDVNAGNVLYFVGQKGNAVSMVTELRGKTLYMTGKGTTPEWTLRYLLAQNEMTTDDLTIEFLPEATAVVSALAENPDAAALLPQPFAQVAVTQNENLEYGAAISDEWVLYSDSAVQSGTATGVTIARRDFLEQHPEEAAQFLADQQASVDYVQKNPQDGAQLIEKYDIVKAAIAQPLLENRSPLSFVSGEKMKAWVSEYLSKLYEISPDAVGGQMPDDGFYYLG